MQDYVLIYRIIKLTSTTLDILWSPTACLHATKTLGMFVECAAIIKIKK